MSPGQPRYLEIAERLAATIVAGQVAPGALLPGEMELAASCGVSRTTIRQALAVLELEGRVRRARGRGTIVTTRLVRHLDPLRSFDYDMKTQGVAWRREIAEAKLISPSADIRQRLGLGPADRVLFVRESRHIAGSPCSVNERYIHPRYRDLYRAEVNRKAAMYGILAEIEGRRTYAEMAIEVIPAPPAQASLLALKRNTLVLMVRFVNYLDKAEPFELVDAYYPVDRWRFVFRRLARVDSGRELRKRRRPLAPRAGKDGGRPRARTAVGWEL